LSVVVVFCLDQFVCVFLTQLTYVITSPINNFIHQTKLSAVKKTANKLD